MATFQQFIAAQGVQFGAGFLNLGYADSITAHAGGGQGSGTALTAQVNRVTAVATAGDSVVLPSLTTVDISPNGPISRTGCAVTVINSGANSLAVFGATGDTIDGGSANASVTVPVGGLTTFWCVTDGAWFTSLNAAYNFSTLTLSGFLYESATTGITAGTTRTQAGATALTKEVNRVDTSTSPSAANLGDGVLLPASAAGLTILVHNNTANTIQVYGTGADTINAATNTVGVAQMANSLMLYVCAAAGTWVVDGISTGFSGSLMTQSFQDGISAAGTTQATGTQLVASLNTVSTVGAGSGVNLPASAPGLEVGVVNTGVNPLLVYPLIGATDTINGVAATVGISLYPGTAAVFLSTAAGKWVTQPGTTKNAGFNTATNTTSFTASAANVTGGAATVDLALTGTLASGQNITLPSATSVILALHCPVVGTSYRLRIINQSSGNFAWTVLQGTGNTLTGATATIAQNASREYVVTVTNIGTPAVTYQNVANATWN